MHRLCTGYAQGYAQVMHRGLFPLFRVLLDKLFFLRYNFLKMDTSSALSDALSHFTRTRVSEHIWFSETRCPCGECLSSKSSFLPDPAVVALFEVIRFRLGLPLQITSCWRCEKHNLAVGGKPDSLHLLGRAIDFVIPEKLPLADTYALLDFLVGDGGFGRYPAKRAVHIDAGHIYGLPPHRRWAKP